MNNISSAIVEEIFDAFDFMAIRFLVVRKMAKKKVNSGVWFFKGGSVNCDLFLKKRPNNNPLRRHLGEGLFYFDGF